jgi:hypothetical protein
MGHDVFISYSSKDKPAADAACAKLEGRGIRCWVAPRDIMPGDDWSSSIIEAINGARTMVLVFSANANASQQIKREVERAVNKGIPVIPLRIQNVAPEKSLEYFISTPHWLDAYTPPLDHHLTYLGDVIAHILEGKKVPPPVAPAKPWWRGVGGLAAGGVVVIIAAMAAWFTVLRPPPGFVGTWDAKALDIHQFNAENGMVGALVPLPLLANSLTGADARGVLTIDASGRYSLAVDGVDHGTVSAVPAAMSATYGGNVLNFVSDETGKTFSATVGVFKVESNSSGTAYSPQTDPPPDGQEALELLFSTAGQNNAASLGAMDGKPVYRGTPDANGNFLLLDLLAGTWTPMPMNMPASSDPNNQVSATLTLTAGGHYALTYTLRETGLWHAANGNWSRAGSVSVGYSPMAPDNGTYTFSGRDQVTLVDQNSSTVWQRGT